MRQIRILLAEMPRMLRDIVESAVSTQDDMQVVGADAARDELDAEVRRTQPDVVIVALPRDDGAGAYDALLYERPRLKLLAVTGDGRGAFLYELRPHSAPIPDVSPGGLVAAIRAATRAVVS